MAGCLFHYGTKRADEKLTEEEWLAQHAHACEKIAVQEHEEITVNGIRYDSWRCTDTQNNQPMVEWYAEQQDMHWVNGCFVFRLTDADGNVAHITGDAGFEAVYADAAVEIMQRILESVQITMQ